MKLPLFLSIEGLYIDYYTLNSRLSAELGGMVTVDDWFHG